MRVQISAPGGRPAHTIHGTITGTDPAGRAVAWSDGDWAGHPGLVHAAQSLLRDREHLLVPDVTLLRADGTVIRTITGGHAFVSASRWDPVAVVAALADPSVCGPDGVLSGDVPAVMLDVIAALTLDDPSLDLHGVVAGAEVTV